MSGMKFDSEKPRTDLLPTFPLIQVAKVLGMGAKKYNEHNWRGGMQWSRPYAATLRHLFSWHEGEDIDPESGLNHIDHAICELLFLRQYIQDYPELDNRYKKPEKESLQEIYDAVKEEGYKNLEMYRNALNNKNAFGDKISDPQAMKTEPSER